MFRKVGWISVDRAVQRCSNIVRSCRARKILLAKIGFDEAANEPFGIPVIFNGYAFFRAQTLLRDTSGRFPHYSIQDYSGPPFETSKQSTLSSPMRIGKKKARNRIVKKGLWHEKYQTIWIRINPVQQNRVHAREAEIHEQCAHEWTDNIRSNAKH